MKVTRRQLKKIIQEAFASTAQEEAEKINAQAGPNEYGMSLVTDQSFWEDRGVYTGEDLAISLVAGTYSDMYKAVHGRRPRRGFESFEEVHAALEDLERYTADMVARDELEAREHAEYERARAELEALMPTGLEKQYDPLPKYSGMGKRTEGKDIMKITTRQLREIVQEAIDTSKMPERRGPGGEKQTHGPWPPTQGSQRQEDDDSFAAPAGALKLSKAELVLNKFYADVDALAATVGFIPLSRESISDRYTLEDYISDLSHQLRGARE